MCRPISTSTGNGGAPGARDRRRHHVITYLWVPCAETPLADRLAALDEHWCAPLLWRSEFRNVLVWFARRRLITFDGARRTADDAESQLRDREHSVPSDAVIRMAASSEGGRPGGAVDAVVAANGTLVYVEGGGSAAAQRSLVGGS